MAHRRVMEHSRWLVVFVFIYGFRSGLCAISLTVEKTVTGYKGASVVIPCTYTASNNEDVIKIEWEFKNQLVVYRDDGRDHIPLVEYRDRVVISKSPPGDVSLTLRKLDIINRGNFKCKVTGRDRNGKLITQEDVTILQVLRTRPPTEQPKVTTAEDKLTTNILITTKPDVRVSTAGEETFTENNVSSSDEHEEIITTKIPHVVTEHIVTESPDMESETTAWLDDTTRTFITVNSDIKVSSVGEEPELTTENIVTETPHMEPEQTTRQDVKTRIFITIIPDVKVSSVGKETDLTTENPVSSIDDHEKKIIPTKNSQPVTEILSTIKPNVKVSNSGGDADRTTENPITENPDIECELTVPPDDIPSNILINGASNEDDSAIARTKQPRKFHSSSFPAYSFTTHVVHNNPPAEAIKTGSGIFFYILIIGLLCIISVLIVTIVLIARRRRRKSFNCNLPTMNQLALNLEGRESNNYVPDFPVSQYESLPTCSHEYEPLALKNPEGNDSQCQSSQ